MCVRPGAVCALAAHERADVVQARKELVDFLDKDAHRIVNADPSQAVFDVLSKPYDHVFTGEEQTLLGVKLGTLPSGAQERPLLVSGTGPGVVGSPSSLVA